MSKATIELPTPIDPRVLRFVLVYAEALAETITVEGGFGVVRLRLEGLRLTEPVRTVEVVDQVADVDPLEREPEPEPLAVSEDETEDDEAEPEAPDVGSPSPSLPRDAPPEPTAGRPGANQPGTNGHRLLTAVADQGGVFKGSISDLVNEADVLLSSGRVIVTKIARQGLLTIEHASPRVVRSISLTRLGWDQLGRTPAEDIPPTPKRNALDAEPTPKRTGGYKVLEVIEEAPDDGKAPLTVEQRRTLAADYDLASEQGLR